MKFIAVRPKLLISAEDILSIEDIQPGGEILTLRGGKTFEIAGTESDRIKELLKDNHLMLTKPAQ